MDNIDFGLTKLHILLKTIFQTWCLLAQQRQEVLQLLCLWLFHGKTPVPSKENNTNLMTTFSLLHMLSSGGQEHEEMSSRGTRLPSVSVPSVSVLFVMERGWMKVDNDQR